MKEFKFKWVKASLTILVTTSLITGSLLFGSPMSGQANKDEQIRQKEAQIAELERQYRDTQTNIRNLENGIEELKREKKDLEAQIAQLDLDIARTEANIEKQEIEIEVTNTLLYQTALELQEAEERVEDRENLLKIRVRAMYESGGTVDYLEVLLGSANFGEFLERLDFLSLLVQQDQKIVLDFIEAKDAVEEKKNEIEVYLDQLQMQLTELSNMKEEYEKELHAKNVKVATINTEQARLKELEEEAFQQATALANQKAMAEKELEELKWDGIMVWPVPDSKRITSYFGNRKDPFTGQTRGHNGMDIGAPQGTSIVAAASGVVLVAEYLNGYGNTVIIEHGDGIRTLYGHIRNGGTLVKAGDRVEQKQKIAEVGSTGRSTGPHLHFEVHKNGQLQDPLDYVPH